MNRETKKHYIQIAEMYYNQDLTQHQIAQKTGINRSTISRMLKKMREEGIVRILIDYDINDLPLEKQLQKTFGLKKAIVTSVNADQSDDIKLTALGQACARFLDQVVADEDTIGFSWGSSLARTIQALSVTTKREHIQCVPLLGGPASKLDSDYHVNTICYQAARLFNGKSVMIDFPAIVEKPSMRREISETAHFKAIQTLWDQMTIAVFGIGSIDSVRRSSTWHAFYGDSEIERLTSEGVAGDICSRFFDIDGQTIRTHLSERTISIPLEKLAKMKYSIGIAQSIDKVKGIIGALRSGKMNVLVTTSETAAALLNFVGD
ncbi:MAG: sugar-binding transcriptional regulator [Sporolactobacillus sp.]